MPKGPKRRSREQSIQNSWRRANSFSSLKQMRNIPIYSEFITLGQLLKVLDMVSSGAEVKMVLAEEKFEVNGEPENRRGKKLYPDDVITLPNGEKVKITPK